MIMTNDQITRLTTELDIRDLTVRYSIAVDDGDLPAIIECFTKEGGFERAGQPVRGHDALRAFFKGMVDRYALTRHVVEMQTLDPLEEPDRATGLVHGRAELVFGDTFYQVAYRYNDVYEREDGRWRFADRQLRFIYYLPAKDLAETIVEDTRVRIPGTDPMPSEHLH